MAKIVPSDLAPSESVHYSFAGVEFDLGGSGKGSTKFYSTDDRSVISNAAAHPWLAVEVDPSEEAGGGVVANQVRPEDDPMSATGPNAGIAFDPAEIAKVEDAKAEAAGATIAIESGLDQSEEVVVGDVAETLAAADAADTTDTKDKN